MLVERELAPDIVVTSSARRAHSTAKLVAAACGYDREIVTTDSLYEAYTGDILEIVRCLPEEHKIALIVGHNPGFFRFAEILGGQIDAFPTSCWAHLAVDIEHWREIEETSAARLEELWYPKLESCPIAVSLRIAKTEAECDTGCTDSTQEETRIVADNTSNPEALERGDIHAVHERIIEDSNYIHRRDDGGDTPLLTAIGFDNVQSVRFLLKHGAAPNVAVDDGYTCLLSAIESDADESTLIVAELIQAGADIHATGTNGWTPIHMAAARGRVESAWQLIHAGADVNRWKEIDASETPLMEAAFNVQPATVRLLLEHGANASMRDTMNNRTPLEIARSAAKGPDPDVVNFLKSSIPVDVTSLVGDMDFPPDQLEVVKKTMKDLDMAQTYIDASEERVETGNHLEVIQILSENG